MKNYKKSNLKVKKTLKNAHKCRIIKCDVI